MRLKDKVAIIVGAGQSPGEGMGNGRATALTFAREGARVLCVDRDLASAQETADMIATKGGEAAAFKADVTRDAEIKAMVGEAMKRWGFGERTGVDLPAEFHRHRPRDVGRCVSYLRGDRGLRGEGRPRAGRRRPRRVLEAGLRDRDG